MTDQPRFNRKATHHRVAFLFSQRLELRPAPFLRRFRDVLAGQFFNERQRVTKHPTIDALFPCGVRGILNEFLGFRVVRNETNHALYAVIEVVTAAGVLLGHCCAG